MNHVETYRGANIKKGQNDKFWIDTGVYSEVETAHFDTIEQVRNCIDYFFVASPRHAKRYFEGNFEVMTNNKGIRYKEEKNILDVNNY